MDGRKSGLSHTWQRSTTTLPFTGTALLSYVAGTEFLRLAKEPDPLCVRHPAATALTRRDGTTCLFLRQGGQDDGYVLKGAAATIWAAAGGFRTRRQVRTSDCTDTYDELVRRSLLLEVDWTACSDQPQLKNSGSASVASVPMSISSNIGPPSWMQE